MVGIPVHAVVAVQEDVITGRVATASERAEVERLVKLESTVPSPHAPGRSRQLVDIPFADVVDGLFWLRRAARPERLTEAKYACVHPRPITVMKPATVARQVGGFVQEPKRSVLEVRVLRLA